MLTYHEAFYQLKKDLQSLYDDRESAAITHEVLEHITGLDKSQRLLRKEQSLSALQEEQFTRFRMELIGGKPLQYVLQHAWFMGRKFFVNQHVLIPRPETEELIQWILADGNNVQASILDIGTGSGCIPVSLKLALPASIITSCDISNQALDVARQNAAFFSAEISFKELDFLDQECQDTLSSYDIIVSNPPYIPLGKKDTMHINVLDYEPELALFVPADDAMLFYRSIASFGKNHLDENGCIYCELESSHAEESKQVFEKAGYKSVELRKDMHGNWRMLKALK